MPWKCKFCGRWNGNDNWDTCVQCGARREREEEESDSKEEDKD